MTPRSLHDLYVHQLRELYSTEQQLLDALPMMAEKAHSEPLRRAFQDHLDETRIQKSRLDEIFRNLGEDPSGVTSRATNGLIRENNDFIGHVENFFSDDAPSPVADAGFIANAQRIEHLEMAGYGTVCTFAKILGRSEDFELLRTTLEEERAADEKLTNIAEEIVNPEAAVV